LGARIVQELGRDERPDLLGRWMAHRIAELITLADKADGDAASRLQETASKAILDLWEHRSSWPRGWPPSALNVTEALREHTQYPLSLRQI
jgi:hypothetical protein